MHRDTAVNNNTAGARVGNDDCLELLDDQVKGQFGQLMRQLLRQLLHLSPT